MDLNQVMTALRLLSKETGRDDLSISSAAAFLYVSEHEGCPVQDIEKYLNVSKSGASRHMSLLGPGVSQVGSRVGLGLVQLKEDPKDRRYKLAWMTPKGVILINKIKSA